MKKNKFGMAVFLTPALLLFLLVFLKSIITLFSNSFFEYVGMSKEFNFGQNFIALFNDEVFLKATFNTFKWVLIQSVIHLSLGVVVALILARKKWYWKIVRTIYMIPNMVAASALGLIFVNLLNARFGAVNKFIQSIGFENFAINWLHDKTWAFFAITMTWLPYAGVVTILVLAEIAAMDRSIFESAAVDGANEFQTIRLITLPNLRNIIMTCCILSATSMLQKFDIIYMSTRGGPDNLTMNLPMYIYDMMKYNDYGMSSAAGLVLIIFGLIIVAAINKVFKLRESV